MICDRYDVVVVPFPFVEKPVKKKRPALVLSNAAFNRSGHTMLAMITTRRHPPWPGDFEIENYPKAGLKLSCIVRFKVFTLDNRLILKKLGRLEPGEAAQVESLLFEALGG